jgi:hypothetical protein
MSMHEHDTFFLTTISYHATLLFTSLILFCAQQEKKNGSDTIDQVRIIKLHVKLG